ncbi:twin-arginine translocase TatA/TatE family subunit [Legionella sp. km772]|nr:twin-arginine translocase TatA/TatE family subunit [Legionella sp. km772]RUR08137.1 twin-arginine translocase TatA/TatE family subunit [Legionella sp. km772]
MSGELLLIFLVTLLVFGPKKLPMLASHLGMLLRHLISFKNKINLLWEQQVQELQLKENQDKAAQADKQYQALDKEG